MKIGPQILTLPMNLLAVTVVLIAASRSERMRWIQAVTPLKSNENDDRIYEEWGTHILFSINFCRAILCIALFLPACGVCLSVHLSRL